MKRIFLSLSMVALVGSLAAIGSTGAFFTDTETSANNIFTAGSIDLKIDHSLSTYNGSSDLVVVTDPTWTFTSDTDTPASGTAVNLTFVHSAWETIAGANWIWATDPVTNPSGPVDQTYTFTKTFNWTGPVSGASVDFGADNYYDVYINNILVGSNHSLITDNFQNPHTTDVTADIVQGINTIKFVGENQHIDGSDFNANPAGIDLKLVIHGQQTFGPTDLTNQTFFNFSDVKPQDTGRDVISMHVSTNDAWSCMIIGNIKNNENDLIAPEVVAGDTPGGPLGFGELGQYLHLFLWHDLNHDGNYNPPTETPITGTPSVPTTINLSGGTTTLAVHDSTTGNGPLLANVEDDVGSAWCAGTLTVDPIGGAITCDGSSVGNNSQTDSTLADLTFYATQTRNQPNFTCSSLGGCSVNPDADLISDGGFESPVVSNAALWDIFPSPVNGWLVDWRSDVPATFPPQTRPTVANMELHHGVLGNAFLGDQYTELDSDWGGPSDTNTGEPASVTIHQTVATVPGTTYNLHFAFAPRPDTAASENTMEVRWGGNVVSTVPPTAGAAGPIVWSTFNIPVTATTTSTTVSFTDLGTADSEGTFLDDVELHATSCVNPS